eukprot:SAG31_NODE_2659_length_5284_cov_6.942152_2_plen_137_part_00
MAATETGHRVAAAAAAAGEMTDPVGVMMTVDDLLPVVETITIDETAVEGVVAMEETDHRRAGTVRLRGGIDHRLVAEDSIRSGGDRNEEPSVLDYNEDVSITLTYILCMTYDFPLLRIRAMRAHFGQISFDASIFS